MADQKTTALPELAAAVSPDDWLYLVDKSDLSDGADGSSKKIQAKNLVGKVRLMSPIENTTPGEFDFDGIPAGYSRIVIEGYVRGDVSATSESVEVFFNTDTDASNYYRQTSHGADGSNSSTESANARIALCPADNSPSGAYGHVRIVIEDYAGGRRKAAFGSFVSPNGTSEIETGNAGVVWDSTTDAITRVRIRTNNHPADQLLGKLSIYGEY